MASQQLQAEVEQYAPAMEELGIEPPGFGDEWNDWDARRALLQLRQRLVIDLAETEEGYVPDYVHQTNLGMVPAYIDELRALHEIAQIIDQEDIQTLASRPALRAQIAEAEALGQVEVIPALEARMELRPRLQAELDDFYENLPRHRQEFWRHEPNLVQGLTSAMTAAYDPVQASSARERLALLNPLSPEQALLARDYLKGDEPSPELAAAFQDEDSADLALDPSRVAALFPREGTTQRPDSWSAEERIPEALEAYPFVSRVDEPKPPPAEVIAAVQQGESPLSNKEAIDYLMEAAGLSLREAKSIIREQARSAKGRKSVSGKHIAMQPSSAVCKLGRSRKLPYEPPDAMWKAVGSYAVVILMSPPSEQPRVMTWRRKAHIDCDFTADRPEGLLDALSQALQSSLLWVAEKPGRMKKNRIFVGTVGSGGLYLVWQPGDPASLNAMAANLQAGRERGPTVTYDDSGSVARYESSLKSTFGTTRLPPKVRKTKRPPRKERRSRSSREAAPASAPTPEPELKPEAQPMASSTSTPEKPRGRGERRRGRGERRRQSSAEQSMMAAAFGIEAEDVAEAMEAPMKAALDLFTPRPPED